MNKVIARVDSRAWRFFSVPLLLELQYGRHSYIKSSPSIAVMHKNGNFTVDWDKAYFKHSLILLSSLAGRISQAWNT